MRVWLGTYQEWVLFSDCWITKFILENLCSRPIRENLCPWKFLAIWCWTFLKASNKHACFVSHYTTFLQPVMFSKLEDVTLHQLPSILKIIFTLHSKLGCFVSSKIGNITLPSEVGHFVSSETRALLFKFGALTMQVSNFLLFYRPLIVHQSRSSSNTSIRAAPARYINLMLAYNTQHVQLSPALILYTSIKWEGDFTQAGNLSRLLAPKKSQLRQKSSHWIILKNSNVVMCNGKFPEIRVIFKTNLIGCITVVYPTVLELQLWNVKEG